MTASARRAGHQRCVACRIAAAARAQVTDRLDDALVGEPEQRDHGALALPYEARHLDRSQRTGRAAIDQKVADRIRQQDGGERKELNGEANIDGALLNVVVRVVGGRMLMRPKTVPRIKSTMGSIETWSGAQSTLFTSLF